MIELVCIESSILQCLSLVCQRCYGHLRHNLGCKVLAVVFSKNLPKQLC